MNRIETRLEHLGLTLPPAKSPIANYVLTKRAGKLLFVAGRVSDLTGIAGDTVSADAAKQAARDTMLDLLAIIRAQIGSLDRVLSVVSMQGFVRSSRDFMGLPVVIDGASDLLVALYGAAGQHARTATGVCQLPFGAVVQLNMVMEIDDSQVEQLSKWEAMNL